MVITFHALMLRSEKNNAKQNALGFTKKKIQPKCTENKLVSQTRQNLLQHIFEMQTNVLCLRLESFVLFC